ncbi:MAG: hypothetical protein ACJ765_05720 [Chloroflexota bacterium]
MTTPVDEVGAAARPSTPSGAPADATATVAVGDICPYLLASQGGWRSAQPNRDHRCNAVDPPAPLPAEKQRDLCLRLEHAACPAFRAARAARASMLAPGLDPAVLASVDAARRPIARTSAVVLEGPRLSLRGGVGTGNFPLYQAGLVVLMILAFAVVLIARLSGPGDAPSAPITAPSATASPVATLSPTPRPVPSPTAAPSASGAVPSGSAAASAAPSAAADAETPTFRTTYRVRFGDTLVHSRPRTAPLLSSAASMS